MKAKYQLVHDTMAEVMTGLVTVHGQLVIVKVVAYIKGN